MNRPQCSWTRPSPGLQRWLLPLGASLLGAWLGLAAEEAAEEPVTTEEPVAAEAMPPATAPAAPPPGEGAGAGEGEGEEPPPPMTDADRLLAEYAKDADLQAQRREAQADFHYNQGQGHLDAGRTELAIAEFRLAVDLMPGTEKYREALRTANTIAGKERSPHNVHIGNLVAEIDVLQQELWVDAERHIELGKKHLARGEYTQAEIAFDLARTRLESLPYQDERREPKLRQVETLIAETKQRRAADELQKEMEIRTLSETRERQRREYELKLENDRIDQLLARALKARDRRDYDETILLCEQVMRINRADARAHELLVAARRERHIYLRQITADQWDEEHKLLSEQIRRDMLPQLDFVVYPEDWHEIDARRSAPTRTLSEEKVAWKEEIERKLEQKLTLFFPELGIDEVVGFLQRNTSVNFVLDPQVQPADVPPITMSLKDVKLRNALEFIMLNTGLKYSLQGEAVYISTSEGLRGDVYMKVYDIRDLTLGITDFPGPELQIPEPGGTGAQLLPEIAADDPQEVTDFIDIIQELIPQENWDVEGTGMDEWNGSLVVTQTGSVHGQIEELLRTLRNQQAVQINVKVRFLSVENTMLEEIGFDWNNWRGIAGWPFNDGTNTPGTSPLYAGPNPDTPQVRPPYWLGGYWADDATSPDNIYGGQLTNELFDYSTGSELDNNGGLSLDYQLYEDPEGMLARVFMRAVEKDRRTNVVIAPDLTLMSGQRAHIVRMNQQAYVADYDAVGAQFDPIVTIISYGTVLDVEAVASADRRYITMTLRPTTTEIVAWRRFGSDIEDFGGVNVINTDRDGNNLGAISGQFPIMIPELSYRSVQTSVTIPDGGSMLIAGMTLGHSARSHSGMPVLSHIPFLGRLFSKNGRSEREYKDLIYVEGTIILFEEIEATL